MPSVKKEVVEAPAAGKGGVLYDSFDDTDDDMEVMPSITGSPRK